MKLKLYERNRTGERVIVFSDKRQRGKYLAQKKNLARSSKLQFTFKRNEYLRVYQNSIMFYELDITGRRVPPKETAEQLFKRLTA